MNKKIEIAIEEYQEVVVASRDADVAYKEAKIVSGRRYHTQQRLIAERQEAKKRLDKVIEYENPYRTV